jgi:hypothetical protein
MKERKRPGEGKNERNQELWPHDSQSLDTSIDISGQTRSISTYSHARFQQFSIVATM